MKNFKTGIAVITSMSLLLGACGKDEVKDTSKDVKTEEVVLEEPTAEMVEIVEETEKVNDVTIVVDQLKDANGKAYVVPKDIKKIAGTYGAYLNENYKNQETRVEVKINDDGTYTLVRVVENTGPLNRPDTYFDKNNNFKQTDKKYHIEKVESGVIANAYGSNVLAPIQISVGQYDYINEGGQLEVDHVSGMVEIRESIELNGDLFKLEGDKINIGGALIGKSNDLQYSDAISKTTGEMRKESYDIDENGGAVVEYKGLNDLFQKQIGESSAKYVALTKEELKKVYTEDNNPIDAKYGYKIVDNYNSEVYVYDGETLYRGDMKTGNTSIVREYR